MLRKQTKRMMALPVPGAILLESAAPTDGVVVAILMQCIAGTVGKQGRIFPRTQAPGLHQKEPACGGRLLKEAVFAEELGGAPHAALLPAPATTFPKVLTVAQQAKANDARAEAEVARPSEGYFYAAPRWARHLFLAFLSLS